MEERLGKVVDKYITISDEYVAKIVNDKIFSNALTNPEIAEGLTKFLNENKDKIASNTEFKNLIPVTGEPIIVKPEQVNNFNLAELRKIAPRAFDKNIFEDLRDTNIKPPQNTPHPSTQNQTRNRG